MRKSKIDFLSLLAIMLVVSSAGAQEISKTASTFHYSVTVPKDNIRTAQVEAHVVLRKGQLLMAPWGYPPALENGWGSFVEDLQVFSDGKRLNTQIEKGGIWQVDAPDGTALTLRYTVRLTHDDHNWDPAGGIDARPAVVEDALFYVTKALFIYSDEEAADATITFQLPDGWVVSSPWTVLPDKPNHWRAGNLTSLINNALVLGKHLVSEVEDGSMTVILAVDPALKEDLPIFFETLSLQLSAYRKIFGKTPDERFLITLRRDAVNDGEAFTSSFNQVFLYTDLSQRKIVWASTFGHELFHYWNGAGRIQGTDHRFTEWFSEGFTEYYASLTLVRTGIVPVELWYKKLEIYMSRFFVTRNMFPGDKPSLVEAGMDKQHNWLLIYGGGASVALMLDIEIRSITDGQKSLDNVMRLMDKRFGDTGKTYTTKDVLAIVNEVSGQDFTNFFEQYVMGNSGLPPFEKTLAKVGLRLNQFADEYYINILEQPSPRQKALLSGLMGK